jgi:predicted alpha/beta hydrolase
MTQTIALSLLPVLLLAAMLWEHHQHRAETRRLEESHRLYCGELLATNERERELWHRERQMLLNRIKPETSQYVAPTTPVAAPPAVGFDDDDDYWQARMPKEQLAAMVADAELEQQRAGEPVA